jgi:tetrahydrodipicolinate N-acetyltransferase
MGATINIGAVVGEGTMVDMNATLGGRATTGKNVHVGAGSVLAGVIEPPSASPVVMVSRQQLLLQVHLASQ